MASSVKLAAAAVSTILMMIRTVCGLQYDVGGSAGWVVNEDLQKWASQYTFYVGDELYFHYKRLESSVLLVTEEDYKDCNTDKEVASDEGEGDMVMTLLTAESYFFVSGHADQCKAGLHVEIPVHDAVAGTPNGQQGSSPSSTDIPSSPVIFSPPRSINTPYSNIRPNASSPLSLGTSFTLFSLALALAFTYILAL